MIYLLGSSRRQQGLYQNEEALISEGLPVTDFDDTIGKEMQIFSDYTPFQRLNCKILSHSD